MATLLQIIRNQSLQRFNTLAFDAIARHYLAIEEESQLVEAIAFARERGWVHQVLSGGSNLLMRPVIEGLTLHMQLQGISVLEQDSHALTLEVAAGENWHALVAYTVSQGWQGIESLALIPGCTGAAPVQNIGAYGCEIKDVLLRLRAYDCQSECFVTLEAQQCQFGYRDSLFKRQPGRYVICSVQLALQKSASAPVNYPVLRQHLSESVDHSPKEVFDAVCKVRSSKLPDPAVLGNAGSFFKNPCISEQHFARIKAQYPDIVAYPQHGEVKLAAGWLIDQCGWRGFCDGPVGVHEKQALVLVHRQGGALTQLLSLAERIRASVKLKYGVELEIEPQFFPLSS